MDIAEIIYIPITLSIVSNIAELLQICHYIYCVAA